MTRQELLDGFDLLARIARAQEPRDLALLAGRVDAWVDFRQPAPAGVKATGSYLLGTGSGRDLYLLPGGALVGAGEDGSVTALPEGGFEAPVLAAGLRRALIESYMGGLGLEDQAPAAVPGTIADLIAVAWDAEPTGRAAIYEILFRAMRPGEGWNQAATRLKAGFERGLNDRSADVRRISSLGLVAMATGTGPKPPTEEPWRILYVLLAVPEHDVHVATLRAIAALPEDRLMALREPLEDLLKDKVAVDDPEERRLAADLRLRLHAQPELGHLAEDLTSTDVTRRLAALQQISQDPEAAEELLPHVLTAVADPDENVRASATSALRPLLDQDPVLRRRILRDFLASGAEDTIGVAVGMLTVADLHTESVRAGLEDAVNRSARWTRDVVDLLARHYRERGVTAAAEGLSALLTKRDAEVRIALLAHLASAPPERQALRDLLLAAITEQLLSDDARVRWAAATTLVALAYPQAAGIVGQLAYDPHPDVRKAAAELVAATGNTQAASYTATSARDVGTLLTLPATGDGDGRVRWLAALNRLDADDSNLATEALGTALARVPTGDADPFVMQAEAELEERITRRTGGGEDLLVICRHLLTTEKSGGAHAAHLAGRIAAQYPPAFDFLWTLHAETTGVWSEAARQELAALAGRPLAPAVRDELQDILARTTASARRDVLRTLLGR